MASDLQIQGEVVVNSEKAESAFARVGDKAQQMANEVSASAGKAGQAVDKIGDGAGASAEKFTRAESRMSAAIKKATNELELLGKTASQRLEFNIADKGLDASKFEPALKKLREVEAQAQAAQRAATGSLDKMGISAAQTAAALRGVPAQFTDIVTSLQGGQAPLTVFLQQGGQLKDMFGGAGNAARALGGYVLGLVNPFTLTAAAVAALAVAYNQGSKEADAYNKAIITTGNAAGTNAAQLKSYAQEISGVVGTQGKAAESLAALAATGKVGAESLKEAAQAAVQYERATGQAVGKTAEQFASLRNEPLAAVLKLNDGMNFLTKSTYEQIKSLEEQGKTAEAARVAQEAYASSLTDRASRIERNLGTIEKGWLAIKDAAKAGWDAMLNVGRASTSADATAELRTRLMRQQEELAAKKAINPYADTSGLEKGIEILKQRLGLLASDERQTKRLAEAEAERAAQLQASAAWDKEGVRFLSDKEKMQRELTRAQNEGIAAGKSQEQIEERLRQIRESYAKKGSSGVASENKELRDQMRVFADLAGVSSTYYTELANYQKQRANNVITEREYVGLVEALIQKQPFAVALAKQQADATKAQAKAAEEGARAHAKYIEELSRGAVAVEQQIDKMRLEEEAAAIASQGYVSLAEAIELVTIARLKEKRDGLLGNEDAYLAVQKEIEAREKLLGVMGSKSAREANTKAAEEAAKDWERTSETISSTLQDYIMTGGRNAADYLKRLFSTLVLQPVVKTIVGSAMGALGLAAPAAAGTSALGTVGNIASGARLLGGLGAFGGGLSGGFGGLMGSLGLSATGSTLGGALSAGSIAIGSGNILGGLGTFAGALGPLALGIGALTSLLGSFKGETRTGGQFGVAFDGQVRNNRRDQVYTYEGQQFDRDFSNGEQRALVDGQAYRLEGDPVKEESLIKDAVSGTAKGIDSFLEALGSSVRVTGFSAGLETSSKDRGGVFAGGTLSNGATFGESGMGDNYAGTLYEKFSTNSPDFKQALSDFSLDLKQSTIQALQQVSDIPESIKKQIEGVDAEALTTEAADALLTSINSQIVGVQQFRGALDAMGLEQFANMAFDTASAIAEAAGGFDALQSSLSGYYEDYYSESEKAALKTKQVKEALAEVGLEMPRTREEFRAMVEANLALGESGAEAVAALLGVEDEFASLAPKVATLADAFAVSGDTIKGILDDALENASSAAEASQMASDAFVESMYSSINDAMTSNLSGLIMGAIQPMVDALIAGATTSGAALASGGAAGGSAVAAGGAAGGGAVAAGGATAGAVMAGVVEQARASISAWATVLSDPQIQASIQEIGALVGGVAGVAYQVTGGAFGGGGSGKWESPGSPSAPGGGGKADEYNKALKSIGETIESEVKRLRGLMVEDSPFSKDVLLAQFATATAQARAGDKDALAKLPDLSKAIEAASAVTAVSAVEMARTRGWLAGSLEETLKALGLTGAGGVTPVITPTTPATTPATTPPKVITPVYNPAINGATMDPALLAAVKELNVTLKAIQSDGDLDQETNQRKLGDIHSTLRNIEELTALSLPTGVTA